MPHAPGARTEYNDLLDAFADMVADRVAEKIGTTSIGARMLSVAQSAEYAGCSEWTIRRAVNLGELATIDFDKRKRILREDVDAWIKRNRNQR